MSQPQPDRTGSGALIALAALGVVALIILIAKREKTELLEELAGARAAREKARSELDGALATIHKLKNPDTEAGDGPAAT